MVVKNALILILNYSLNHNVEAYKYSSFYYPANTVETRLPDLPLELVAFSLCKLENDSKVILSGGVQGYEDKYSA